MTRHWKRVTIKFFLLCQIVAFSCFLPFRYKRRNIFIGLWTFVATFCLHTSNKDPTRIEFTISFFTPTSRMKFKQEPFLLQNSGNFAYWNRIPGSFCRRWNLTIRLRLHQPSPFLLLLFLQKLWKEGAFCLEYRFLMQFQFLPDP